MSAHNERLPDLIEIIKPCTVHWYDYLMKNNPTEYKRKTLSHIINQQLPLNCMICNTLFPVLMIVINLHRKSNIKSVYVYITHWPSICIIQMTSSKCRSPWHYRTSSQVRQCRKRYKITSLPTHVMWNLRAVCCILMNTCRDSISHNVCIWLAVISLLLNNVFVNVC